MRRLPLLALVCLALPCVLRVPAAHAEDGVIALVGGEIHTASGDVIPAGTVVIEGDRIRAVGATVDVPEGAVRVDCSGLVVTPGLIDADSTLGLDGADSTARIPGAYVGAAAAFDPWDARVGTALANGVTSLQLGGARDQLVAGLAAVVSTVPLGDGASGEAPASVEGSLVLSISTRTVAGGAPGASRAASLRTTLRRAVERREALERYGREIAEYEEKRLADDDTDAERLLIPAELAARMSSWTPEQRAAWREAAYKAMGRAKEYEKPKKSPKPPSTVRDDDSTDILLTAMSHGDGKDAQPATRATLFRAELSPNTDAALAMGQEFGLDLILAGGEGLVTRADAVKKAGARVILTNLSVQETDERRPIARRPAGAGASLVAAGLRPALATGGSGATRFLRLYAAHEVGTGMDPADALRGITLWAAESAGVDKELGSIDEGKRADIVVWNGDPLAIGTRALRVFVAGREVHRAIE